MTLPDLTITISDGALGYLPPSSSTARLKIGPSLAGTANTVYAFSSVSQVLSTLNAGPLAAACAHELSVSGGPVYAIPCTQTAGLTGAVTHVGTGPTVTASGSTPTDDYEILVTIVAGGSLATATYTISLDNGKTTSATATTGSGTPWTLTPNDPNGYSTGVTLSFPAGTYVAGDTYALRVYGPSISTTNLTAAMNAWNASGYSAPFLHVVSSNGTSATDATNLSTAASLATQLETNMATMAGSFRYMRAIIESPDIFAGGNFTSAWDTSASTAYAGVSGTRTGVCSGHALVACAMTGLQKRRNAAYVIAARIGANNASNQLANDPAWVGAGAIPGIISLLRDERAAGTKLSDYRQFTLRSHLGIPGYFVAKAPMLTSGTSDFQYYVNGAVIDLVTTVARAAALPFLAQAVRVKPDGTIWETDAGMIESVIANALQNSVASLGYISPPTPSTPLVQIDKTVNVLSTSSLSILVRVTPKGYARSITLNIGFNNVSVTRATQ